ncbi:hypothetical protein AGLY_007308 [Aphis glycines]|uniref:Uncharacterized protein n=1 Tax=Aphis glycines TaxID=307491 RepID=A0A6G0TP68_APHGL|nr:hypothetical protein AGLY_007308 [Aphis glycines]
MPPAARLPPSLNYDNTTSFPIVDYVFAEAGSTPLQNRDQMSCRIDMHSNPVDFMGNTLVFWLFIATLVLIKVEAIDDKVINDLNFAKKYQPPTINTQIGDQHINTIYSIQISFMIRILYYIAYKISKVYFILFINIYVINYKTLKNTNKKLVICRFWVGRFLSNVPMFSKTQPSNSIVNNLNWLYDKDRNHMLEVRNLTNLFKNGLIGSRPMYRNDVLFDGNVAFLKPDLKNARTKRIDYSGYLMAMTRICSVADVKEETHGAGNHRYP